VAKNGSSVRTRADLSGKTVAYTGPGSSTHTLAELCTANVSNVRFRATGGIGTGLAALTSGGVDAAPVVEPTLSSLMAETPRPYQIVFRGSQCTRTFQTAVLVVRKQFARQYPGRVRGFLKGWQRALNAIYANPGEASRRWTKALNLDKPTLAVPFLNEVKKNKELELALSLAGMQVVVQRGLPALNIKGPVEWGRLINQGYLPKGTPRVKLTAIGQPPS
jgi:NitT/TauT family transport system substrate-binding protein